MKKLNTVISCLLSCLTWESYAGGGHGDISHSLNRQDKLQKLFQSSKEGDIFSSSSRTSVLIKNY